jgi:putative salt-induced outer membrane protein YdiY
MIVMLCPLHIFADQIVLKNGDKLTGKIIKKDGDSIVIQTEFAGVVTIKWEAVEKVIADNPVNIKLSDGQLIKGTVATNDSDEEDKTKFQVDTADAGTVEIEKEKIEIVRSEEEQAKVLAAEERLRNPSLLNLWEGTADVGFSLTSGNSDTRALTAGFRATRETRKDKIGVYANLIQASNSTSGTSVTTAEAIYGGIRYDYNLSEKTFVFASGDFEYDKPQLLDLRSVIGAGFGYKAIRSERTKLDVFGGATYNRENFSTGVTRNSAEGLIGNDLSFRLTDSVSLEQRFKAYPSLSNFGEFRALFDASVITNLNDWLGWQVTLGDRYNSNPTPGAVSNDILFTTGLRATFGKKNK